MPPPSYGRSGGARFLFSSSRRSFSAFLRSSSFLLMRGYSRWGPNAEKIGLAHSPTHNGRRRRPDPILEPIYRRSVKGNGGGAGICTPVLERLTKASTRVGRMSIAGSHRPLTAFRASPLQAGSALSAGSSRFPGSCSTEGSSPDLFTSRPNYRGCSRRRSRLGRGAELALAS